MVVASPKAVKGRHLKLSKWRDDYKAIQEMRTIEESMEFKIPCKDLSKIKKRKAGQLHFRSERGQSAKPQSVEPSTPVKMHSQFSTVKHQVNDMNATVTNSQSFRPGRLGARGKTAKLRGTLSTKLGDRSTKQTESVRQSQRTKGNEQRIWFKEDNLLRQSLDAKLRYSAHRSRAAKSMLTGPQNNSIRHPHRSEQQLGQDSKLSNQRSIFTHQHQQHTLETEYESQSGMHGRPRSHYSAQMRFSKVSHPQISRAISTTIRKKKEKQVSTMLSQNSQLQSLLREKFGIQTNEIKMPAYSKIQNFQ